MKAFSIYCLRKLLYFLLAFIYINASAQLHAGFSSNIKQGCSPLVVQFADSSSGSPAEWYWDLGNGAISTQKDPGAIYITPGSYTVKLYVKNALGEDSVIESDYIKVYENPTPSLKAKPTEGCAPFNVDFTDKSIAGSGIITDWIWDFGDGIVSNLQNPSHTYSISDTFDVVLSVTNSFGCKKTLQEPSIIKVGSLIEAGFNYNYSNVCNPPATVAFVNTTSPPASLSYQWLFGDGTVSTEESPVHIYTTPGNFTAQLTAINESGCSAAYQKIISIGSAKADFDVTNACVNEQVVFTDNSIPKPISEIWDFGDGQTGTGYQVKHTYKTAGTFQITLSADFGGCTDTTRKIIKTDDKIQANFTTTGKLSTCNFPVTIQFNNITQGATGFKWFFGDGTSSTMANPEHTYKDAGEYSVMLIAYNANGCPDTIEKKNLIQLGPPKITGIENLPFSGCAPQTLTFKPLINSDDKINFYKWSFGDGNISNDSVPKHMYNTAGIYGIQLIVTTTDACSDTLLMPNAISLGNTPTAFFNADPLSVCAETFVQFKDSSTGLITDWLWLFGDGTSSTQQNPKHSYTDTGYLNVSLIVSQYECYDTLTLNNYVYVKAPVAKFDYSSDCSSPYTYNFIDHSIAPETWHWDFGDGNTSDMQNVTHVYNSKGFFYVSLTVTNGNCSFTKKDTIKVIQVNPTFNYESVSPNSCKYDSIHFSITGYDPSNIKSFRWDFGDGITESSKKSDIYHSYNNAGTYVPVLYVRDANNCLDTINKDLQLEIFGPHAAFVNKAGDCLFSPINFKDESSTDGIHSITKWIWNYGDNTIADTLTSAPFIHTYQKTGLFNVALKIIDNNNCYDTVANINTINITQPVANFSVADTLSCMGSAIRFIDSSNGVSLLYTWDFGDGKRAHEPEPLHNYSFEGLYNVQLILKDKYGCTDTASKPQYIRVANPVADFLLPDSLFVCPPAKINPQNSSLNFNALTWDFGDGNTSSEISPEHYYNLPGTYILKLTVQGYGNCSDAIQKPLVIKGPLAKLSYTPFTGCNPLSVSFSAKAKNAVGYIWDFGDGVTQSSADSNASYVYPKPGKFIPQLVIVDSSGCRVSVVNNDTIVIFGTDTRFSANLQPQICDSAGYIFSDSSTAFNDEISSYYWQFGDGDLSFDINPHHYYHTPALYNTSLTIKTKKGCIESYQLPLDVLINSTPKIFATIPDSACINSSVSLAAGVSDNSDENFEWMWNLGNGLSAYNKDTSCFYNTDGQYNLFVVGTSLAGCSDTVFGTMRIDPLPVVDAGFDSIICKGKSIMLNAKGADSYTWLADASLSCTDCTSPLANPLYNTTYFLTGTNSFGCKADDSVNIGVKQPANVSINITPDTICVGNTVQLRAAGAEIYSWQPSSLIINSNDSSTSSTPKITTTYSVIGKDRKGCFSDTAYEVVNVFPYPALQIKDSVITIEAGTEYQINAIGSEDIIFWQWNPLSGISCSNCPQPIVAPKATQTYTVNVRNIAGCSLQKQVTITVLCKGENLFIPNTFSPNADGMNDYFYPRGKGFSIKSFRIFSRWGTVVFQQNNFPPNQQSYGWNGTYNGKALQPDVYIFLAEILCDNGTVINSKGNVTLLR